MRTIAIIGAGPGLGMSLAQRFGKEGFQVALVARNVQKLQELVKDLEILGIEASYFIADITSKTQLENAIVDIETTYGSIDVMEYSPMTWDMLPTPALDATEENVLYFLGSTLGAINVVNAIAPQMIKKGEGALLFTTDISAFYPMPPLASASIAASGMRNYIAHLQLELAPHGITVANRALGVRIDSSSDDVNNPDVIADMWWHVYNKKLSGEDVYPEGVTPHTMIA